MTNRVFLSLVLGFAGLASSAQGAAYTTAFDAPFVLTKAVAGTDGWVINDGGADPITYPAPGGLSVVSTWSGGQPGSTNAGALGGIQDASTMANVELTHAYGMSLSGSSFDVDFDIEPSILAFPGRDNFGFSFKGPLASNLMSVIFKPSVAPGQLEILWADPAAVQTSTGFDLFEGGTYHLSIDFGAVGPLGSFTATLTPGIGAPLNFGGSLAGAGLLNIDNFGVDWDVNTPGGGSNFILFDNISMVPEPGSAVLVALGLLGAVRRRRTA